MSNRTEAATLNGDQNQNHVNENTNALGDVVRQLPPHAVNDLLSIGVCVRCIGRLFGIRELVCSAMPLSRSIFDSVVGEKTNADNHTLTNGVKLNELESMGTGLEVCSICLGVLQFTYQDEKGTLVKKDSANDFCQTIAEFVKQEGYCIDDFSLEVSIPPIVLENEDAIWLHMKKKYGAEQWIQDNHPGRISVKDALKFSIVDSLEKLLDVKSYISSFRIRIIFTHAKSSKMIQNTLEKSRSCKRQKQGTETSSDTVNGSVVAGAGNNDNVNSAADVNIECSFKNLEDSNIKFPAEKVNEPCCLALTCYKTPIFFGGRYLKYSRNVSQTRWIIDDERMGESSVEEIIGGNILPLCNGDNFKFHAAGREDIDVRMLGSGRPFLVEIQNARCVPSDVFVKEIESKINNSENKLVSVKNLKLVDSQGWDLMREGEAEKQKQYAALVWISRPLEDIDVQTLTSLKEMQILQKTPIRVLHRRSPMERGKIIHWMNIERIAGSAQYFILQLCTQAGTYIKEFVHGDLGRTYPSVGSILGCRAEILQLDVTDVKMDCFLSD